MPFFTLAIRPIDPLISRDSRPFGRGQGRKVRSLNWLTQSTVCGALRTRVGKIHGSFDVADLKSIKIRGPFLECENSLYFPRPLDFIADKATGYAIRPKEWKAGGTEMPLDGLLPASIQNPPQHDFKPEHLPDFWSASAMEEWLADPQNFSLKKCVGLSGPTKEERVHVSINPATGASEDSLLFSTTGLDFRISKEDKTILQLKIALEVESPDIYDKVFSELSSLHPLGGERRLADWSVKNGGGNIKGWSPPSEMPKASSRLRMVLATPAIFSKGWLPGWISEKDRTGIIPETKINVRLVSAIVGRWEAISGWSYEKGKPGIKPIRRMVPAGSVYFFETVDTNTADFDWQKLWLRSVCDEVQDCNDGFGAALWGTW